MVPETKDVEVEIEGKAAILSLNRSSKLNALRWNTFREITALMEWADGEKEIGAVIIQGKGKSFCAGVDINEYASLSSEEKLREFQIAGRQAYESPMLIRKPVIAAVHGYALGGGFALALGCDIIIASEDAKFGFPEIKRGMIPGGGTTARMPFLLTPYVARSLIFTGRIADAAEMMRSGTVSSVVEPSKLTIKSMEYARSLTEMPSDAMASMKSLMNNEVLDSARRYYSDELDRVAALFASDERGKRMSDFTSRK